jgi:hypothetical protein
MGDCKLAVIVYSVSSVCLCTAVVSFEFTYVIRHYGNMRKGEKSISRHVEDRIFVVKQLGLLISTLNVVVKNHRVTK